ncbi:MAG: 50S ribosomal protein L17 [Bdellovibrionota bacterium]|nr:MAG: 50S ribosomal protein L17 [Bdellovibrionota bacterium]
MRHGVAFRKFARTTSHRRAMFRNLATSLLLSEHCETTIQKAKDLRRVVEPLITLAREDTLAARRRAYSYLLNKQVVHKLFADIGPRFKARPGGYTRIVRTRSRPGDAADMAIIQLVDGGAASTPAPKKKTSSKKAAPAKAEAKSKKTAETATKSKAKKPKATAKSK